MFIEVDDFLEEYHVNEIERFLSSISFPWYYNPSLSGDTEKIVYDNDNNIKDVDGFIHIFSDNNNILSAHAEIIRIILGAIEKKLNFVVKDIKRSRAVLVYKNPSFGDFYQVPHTDYTVPHLTLIYYVNDNDGDTVFFTEMYKEGNVEKKTLQRKITPKKGKCVVFDGLQYHTGSVPTDKNRILININFLI